MKENKFHTPDGFKDFLPQAYAYKLETENKIRQVFHSYGFNDISSPSVEYLEVFTDKDVAGEKKMYKFFDRDGDTLTLRPDMTPPVARIVATHYEQEDTPLRLCYIENTFRYNESYQGKTGEFTQAGVELVGVNTCDAGGEVIAIAIDSLLSSGLRDFRIDLGHAGFLRGALEETGLDAADIATLADTIQHNDFVAVNDFIKSKNITGGISELMSDMTQLTGDIETIKKVKSIIKGKKALDAIIDLEETYEILRGYGFQDYILFDLGISGHLDYYTGIIFKGYAYGSGFTVLDGGRYDNLIAQYGRYFPSVGFAIKTDDLISALQSQGIEHQCRTVDTLLVYTHKGRETGLSVSSWLRSQGSYIENSLLGHDLDTNINYAKKKNIGGILYFEDDENVRLIDVKGETEEAIKISELLSRGGVE